MSVSSSLPGTAAPPAVETTAAQPVVELPPIAQESPPLDDSDLMTQELRLAITFTGGVSLAVWMGGVAREIDLLVQASDGPRGTPGVHYRGVLDLMDTAVSVDCISGTSAGGINAALLGLAHSQCLDLSALRATWLRTGALRDLLRDPRKPEPTSLLQGDAKLLTGLNEAFDTIRPRSHKPVRTRRTDVFITTTLLSSETSRFVDDYGTEITDADHHGLFHFNQQAMLDPAANRALALAARSSASFPGAFEPSFVPVGAPGGDEFHPDMSDYSNTTRSHWAADGGLLVNRPIAPLLQTIFDRGAEREVRRALLYVVPTSRLATTSAPDVQSKPLGLANSLLRDVVATLNQSIASDLESIREHNDRTRSAADTRLRMAALGARLNSGGRLVDQRAWDTFRERQSQWLATPLITEVSRQLAILPNRPKGWCSATASGGCEDLHQRVAKHLADRWPADLPDGADAAILGRAAYDSAKATVLRLLRLGFILASKPEDRLTLAKVAGDIKAALDDQRSADLRPLVRSHIRDTATQQQPPDLQTMVTGLADDYAASLTTDQLAAAWAGLAAVVDKTRPLLEDLARKTPRDAVDATAGSLRRHRERAADELDRYLRYFARDDVTTQLLDLHIAVRSVLPLLVEVEQAVELIQVSADTRTLLDPDCDVAAEKLTGLQFHHFGAFYKATWRANDWMWGRLDGCGWLIHVLLSPHRMIALADNNGIEQTERVAWFQRRLVEKLGLTEQLPADIAKTLAFLGDDTVEIPASLPDLSLWVAERLQRDIAAEELTDLAALMHDDHDCRATGPAVAWLASMDKALKVAEGPARTAAVVATLPTCPVSRETFESESGTPLFLRTLTQSIAVTTAAVTTMKAPPAALRPTFATARSVTQTAYVAADKTHGKRGTTTMVGLAAIVAGILAMLDNNTVLGLSGLVAFATGALLLALCVGKTLWRATQALVGLGVILLAAAPWLPYLDQHLFPWLHRTLFRWLEVTVIPRADGNFLPWLQSHKWVWPVIVLVILLAPLMALFSWVSSVGRFRAKAARTRAQTRRPAAATPLPSAVLDGLRTPAPDSLTPWETLHPSS